MECYNGIIVPDRIEETCGGDYKSTSCVASPIAIPYLSLSANATQTQINNAIVLALFNKDSQIAALQLQIDDLKARVEILETL